MSEAKPFCISKRAVWEACKKVKANQAAAGVDEQSIAGFEKRLEDNLYKIWNRMSSGSYFPPPVRAVKKHAKDEWVVLYIERWLKAPAQDEEGRLTGSAARKLPNLPTTVWLGLSPTGNLRRWGALRDPH